MNPNYRFFTPEEDDRIVELRRGGLTFDKIALALGRKTGGGIFSRWLKISEQRGLQPAQAPAAAEKGGGRVRCLGPGCGKTFHSPDRCRIRFCAACRRKRHDHDGGLPESFARLL